MYWFYNDVYFILIFLYIIYLKFLPERVLWFQHCIVYYILENWIKNHDASLDRSFFDFINSYLIQLKKQPKN